MKAIQFNFSGGHSTVEVPTPKPADDQVLVKVVNAALDTAHDDVVKKTAAAGYLHSLKDPLYLGYHFAGVVEKVGSKVVGLEAGSEVFGHLPYENKTTQGSFAEYIVVKSSECGVKPSNVSFATAAASTTESLTALQGIRDLGGLSEGKTILINGAAGGVGSAAVGIAIKLGAHVTAVCSKKDVQKVKDLGAHVVIDRSKQDVMKSLKELSTTFDVIFDTPNAFKLPLGLLNKGGVMVITIPDLRFFCGKVITLMSSKSIKFIHVESKKNDLELVGEWLQNGLEIFIDSTHDVKDIDAAIKRQNGQKHGRVVIQVEGGW
jgi:NADPH:quinone reductase-like Zn-dependent oxidoreductase